MIVFCFIAIYRVLFCALVICLACSFFSLQVEPGPHLLSPLLDHLYLPHYKSPTAPLDLTCGINSLFYSVNPIVVTLPLVHLILRISPHHSHHLRSHHLSLPRPFTPD